MKEYRIEKRKERRNLIISGILHFAFVMRVRLFLRFVKSFEHYEYDKRGFERIFDGYSNVMNYL